jgi:hypothetical protein
VQVVLVVLVFPEEVSSIFLMGSVFYFSWLVTFVVFAEFVCWLF